MHCSEELPAENAFVKELPCDHDSEKMFVAAAAGVSDEFVPTASAGKAGKILWKRERERDTSSVSWGSSGRRCRVAGIDSRL